MSPHPAHPPATTTRLPGTRPALPVRASALMTRRPVCVHPSTPLREAVRLLLTRQVSSLPVTDADDRLLGVVSVSDLITREGFPQARSLPLAELVDNLNERRRLWTGRAKGSTVADVMSTEVITCAPDEPVPVLVRRMLARNVQALPVVEDGNLVGIVARRDCLALFDRPDEEIQRDVTDLLGSALWTPEGHVVQATTDEGIVTLTGTARHPDDTAMICDVVRQVPGVVDVVDEVVSADGEREGGSLT